MPLVRSGAVPIYYNIRGDGPALVFHTGAGGDHRIWECAGYLDALPGFRKILIDQRGRGQSGRPTKVEDHRMSCYTADVAAVLDDADVDSAGFWGYSNGTTVGVAFGAAYPKRLKALVGTGSLRFADLTELPKEEDPDAFIQKTVAQGGVGDEVDAFMQRDNERFPEAIDRNVREGDPLMYALDDLAWSSWPGPKSLYPTFKTPVLMITGEREDLKHNTEKSVAVLPNARVVRVPGLGHLATFVRSDLALPHVIPFLREHLG